MTPYMSQNFKRKLNKFVALNYFPIIALADLSN